MDIYHPSALVAEMIVAIIIRNKHVHEAGAVDTVTTVGPRNPDRMSHFMGYCVHDDMVLAVVIHNITDLRNQGQLNVAVVVNVMR